NPGRRGPRVPPRNAVGGGHPGYAQSRPVEPGFLVVNEAAEPMTGDGTLVVVATYNERENIEPLLTQVLAQAPGCRVLVVDDNSPDGTGEIARELAAHDARVEVLGRERKLGLGTAYLAGFQYAREKGFDRMMTMDADFSHHPRHLPSLLARALEPGVDVVIGSRDGERCGGVR